MGSQMTKELGVYNEEEKVSTPLGTHRFKLLSGDPRSATLGIKRTPIQVHCTPIRQETTGLNLCNSFKKSESSTAEFSIGNEGGSDIDGVIALEENKDNESDIMQGPMDVSSEVQLEILDNNDIVETSTPFPVQKAKPLLELADVRSPSIEISRTPILVECTPELFALHSQIESLSFCDVDVHQEDPSAILSDDDDQSCRKNVSTINKWLFGVENQTCNSSLSNSFVESPRQVARKQKELTALKKQLFLAPDCKDEPKPKVRTPLGDLQASQLKDSPKMMVRSKQWRNIQEERKLRGITDTENTPPSLPPLSKISSAPGKMLDRKRSKINWDENTMLI